MSALRKEYQAFCASMTGPTYLGPGGYYKTKAEKYHWLFKRKDTVSEEDSAWLHAQMDMAAETGD